MPNQSARMKVIYSDAAKADLRKISNWIAEENPVRAHSFVAELTVTCEALTNFPFSNQALGVFHGVTVRRKTHGNYLIFYVVSEHKLEIARVLHGAQDYSDLF
jgi:toxin ParE1/3/4